MEQSQTDLTKIKWLLTSNEATNQLVKVMISSWSNKDEIITLLGFDNEDEFLKFDPVGVYNNGLSTYTTFLLWRRSINDPLNEKPNWWNTNASMSEYGCRYLKAVTIGDFNSPYPSYEKIIDVVNKCIGDDCKTDELTVNVTCPHDQLYLKPSAALRYIDTCVKKMYNSGLFNKSKSNFIEIYNQTLTEDTFKFNRWTPTLDCKTTYKKLMKIFKYWFKRNVYINFVNYCFFSETKQFFFKKLYGW